MKKLAFLFLTVFAISIACKEEDLRDENPAPSPKNVDWTILPYYGDSVVRYDTLEYVNNIGERFFIDSISFLISDVSFIPQGGVDDTVDTGLNLTAFDKGNMNHLIAEFPAGGYSGFIVSTIGIDSSTLSKTYSASTEELDAISKFKRVDNSYNHLHISGRYLDALDPLDSIADEKFTINIGSVFLADTIFSSIRTFSVNEDRDIIILMACDIKSALEKVVFYEREEIQSDITNQQDFDAAERFAKDLSYTIF